MVLDFSSDAKHVIPFCSSQKLVDDPRHHRTSHNCTPLPSKSKRYQLNTHVFSWNNGSFLCILQKISQRLYAVDKTLFSPQSENYHFKYPVFWGHHCWQTRTIYICIKYTNSSTHISQSVSEVDRYS